MAKRLVIDLERCEDCASCAVSCAYFYRAHAADHGVMTLREQAAFALVCRRCEEPSCVDACRFEALERRPDGVLERFNLRCVSCGCCAQACPFGTICPDLLTFYATPCDYCARLGETEPPCVAGCTRGALAYREVAPDEEQLHLLGDRLAVKARAWQREEAVR
jgi:Fe-S-cluster-containing dehydrogenase component